MAEEMQNNVRTEVTLLGDIKLIVEQVSNFLLCFFGCAFKCSLPTQRFHQRQHR